MKKNIFFIILSIFVLFGCGYTTRSILPPGDNTIHVDNFANKINITAETTNRSVYNAYRPGMEIDITRNVIDWFIFDGNYEVESARDAHFTLKGALTNFKREPLRYDTNENVIEYRLSVVTNLELHDNDAQKILWQEEGFAGESTYRTTGQYAKSESTALQEAIRDLARRIVERTVENW